MLIQATDVLSLWKSWRRRISTMLRIMFKLFFAGVLALGCLAGPSLAQVPTSQPQCFPLSINSMTEMLHKAGFQPMMTVSSQTESPMWGFKHPQSGKTICLSGVMQGGQICLFDVICEMPMPLGGVNPQLLSQVNSKLNPYVLMLLQPGNELVLARSYYQNDSNPQELLAIVTDLVAKAGQAQQLLNGQPPVAPAPAPVAAPGQVLNLAGPTGSGQENFSGGWTKLSFQFQQGGTVTMADENQKYQGTWTQNGNQVTIQLPDIVTTFQGTVTGNTITGQGQGGAGPWSFNVAKTK
jgi:hypothetical protein